MRWCLALAVVELACGCSRKPAAEPVYGARPLPGTPRIYVLGVQPLQPPRMTDRQFGPLVAHLEQHTGYRFRLEAPPSYEAFEQKVRQHALDFALSNAYQTLRSLDDGYRALAKMGDDASFRGIFLVRRNEGGTAVSSLRGKRIAFPANTALAATLLTQRFLQDHGLVFGRDYEAVYVGSQESSIMGVLKGEVAAAATLPWVWHELSKERPELAAALTVQWETGPLPNSGLVVGQTVPDEVSRAVAEVLLHLHESDEGRRLLTLLGLSRFEPATAETWAPVREFLRRFSTDVRPLP